MEAFPQWIIILIVVIVLSKIAVLLARRFGLPASTIQLLIGILLGPSLLNLLGAPIILGTWGSPSASPFQDVLKIIAEIGLIELMFLAGLQTDWHELEKMLKPIFSVGAWGFALTAVIVVFIARCYVDRWAEALALGAIMSVSSFGISANNFTETKFVSKRVAQGVLGVSILSGVLAILLMIASLSVNYGMAYGGFRMTIAVSWFLGKLVMFFAIAYFLTSRFLRLSAKTNFQKRPNQMLVGYLLLVASLYGWAAMHFGGFAAVGVASLGGALLGTTKPGVKEKIEGGLGSILASIPVGVFFVVFGMEMNLKGSERYMIFLTVLFAAVIAAKLMGWWIATSRTGGIFNDRFSVGLGTLPQGEMGMLIAAYLFSRGVIDPLIFNTTAAVVVLLTMVTPVLMKVAPSNLPRLLSERDRKFYN
jgi:Kef-type K+ transport system membrane component KefB